GGGGGGAKKKTTTHTQDPQRPHTQREYKNVIKPKHRGKKQRKKKQQNPTTKNNHNNTKDLKWLVVFDRKHTPF
ncbi:hypothetical protein ACNITF_25260, partial [Escherichia coli]